MARGQLRIYLGAAPGVGKTVAMLAEGARRAQRGTDVVIGIVETHGRPFTQQQTVGLVKIPKRRIAYRGSVLEEMDLDAILAREPQVVLVDELAHTNAPGSEHEKRWQDIDTLLDAGIDVISTVNIQHLESLNDAVTAITGIVQRETVPDQVVRAADQIDLVDMSPEALRRRMAHGNVYPRERVDAALSNYFRIGNLAALRELALLWMADRVDEGLEVYRADHGIGSIWPTRERVVVALSGGPEGETILRRGARIASRGAGGELLAVYVSRSDGLAGPSLPDVARLRRLTEELGGTFHSVTGSDPAQAILEFARGSNASQIILGISTRPFWQKLIAPGISDAVIAGSGEIDVHVVTHEGAGSGFKALASRSLPKRRVQLGYALSLVLPLVTTGALQLFPDPPELALVNPIYLLLTVLVALVGGLVPAIVAAVVGTLLANWFFTPPLSQFTIQDPQNVLALVVSVTVGVLVASVVHANARRTAAALTAQREATAMAELTNVLLGSTDQLALLLDRAVEMFGLTGAGVIAKRDGQVEVVQATENFDFAHMGSSDQEPMDAVHCLVLQPGGGVASQRRLMTAFAIYAAAILQRRELVASAATAESLARDNRARTALLSAVSHDLRTPLAGIKAAIGSLRSTDVTFTPEEEAELKELIEQGADRLDDLIGNLLDMSRLQAGALVAKPRLVDLAEVLPGAISTLAEPERVDWDVTPEAREVVADPGLLERVLGNIGENALRHQPSGKIVVWAERMVDVVELRVSDNGPGIPPEARERIFMPFQRYGDTASGEGVGLGLAVARGLTEAMGGTVTVEDTPGGGLTLLITLPTRMGQIVPVIIEKAERDQ